MKGYHFRNIQGLTYRFHHNTNGYDIDVKLNDAYARSAGNKDLSDFLADNDHSAFNTLIEDYGRIPKYIPVRVDGKDSEYVSRGKEMMKESDSNLK